PLTPAAALANNTQYTATNAKTAKGSNGCAEATRVICRSTTIAAPLTVTSTAPAANATGVATGVVVSASFNKPLDATTINGSSFKIGRAACRERVDATVASAAGSTSATLTPTAATPNENAH